MTEGAAAPGLEITEGYRTGLIAAVTGLHADYYARSSGFGQKFESVVAAGLAGFCDRLDAPRNRIWLALHQGRIAGSVAIDGEDLGGNVAHLRWFILSDDLRGSGAGRALLRRAMEFVDAAGFDATRLWTFRGLAAARHLYEAHGFVLEEETSGAQWGTEVMEQRFMRPARAGMKKGAG